MYETLVCDHSNEATEQYFHVVLFIMLSKVVLSYKFVGKTLLCGPLIKQQLLRRAFKSGGFLHL